MNPMNDYEIEMKRHQEKIVNREDLDFDVYVHFLPDAEGLIFKLIRRVEGIPMNCAFIIGVDAIKEMNGEKMADLFNNMFKPALMSMAQKIRNGIISNS